MGTVAVSTPAGPEQWVVAVWLSIESPVGAMWGTRLPPNHGGYDSDVEGTRTA
jgi:hypothetical protein